MRLDCWKRPPSAQRTVGDELYQAYSQKRTDLIQELHLEQKYPLANAIEWARACSTA